MNVSVKNTITFFSITGLRMQMSALKEPRETSFGIAWGLVNVRNVNVFVKGIRSLRVMGNFDIELIKSSCGFF